LKLKREVTLETFGTILRKWSSELDAQIAEACRILSDAPPSDGWWASCIRKNLTSAEGPSEKEGETVLVDICFWSGWLRGQRDALQNCIDAYNLLSQSDLHSDGRTDMDKMISWLEINSSDPAMDALALIVRSALAGQPVTFDDVARRYIGQRDLATLLELSFAIGIQVGRRQ